MQPVLFYKHLNSFIHCSSFMEISSEHLHSQIVRARNLTFWEKVHLSSPVMCLMSRVTCNVSYVTHKKNIYFLFFSFFLDKGVQLVDEGLVINKGISLIFIFNKLLLCSCLALSYIKNCTVKVYLIKYILCGNTNFDKIYAVVGVTFILLKSCWWKILDI